MVRAQEAQRVIRELRPILPALRELDSLADALTRGGTLTELLDRYWSFARKWLVMPMPAETRNAVREALRPPAVEGEEGVAGGEFLHWLSRRLNALVIPGNQMLDPHVVVMTGFPERGAEPLFVMPRGDDEEAFARTPDQSPHGALPHATSASETVTNRQWNSSLANGRAGTRERKALAPAKLLFLEIDPAWLQDWGSRAGRPVSATGLALFLSCPYRFALERMARLQPPAPHLHTARISPHVFGELVHGGVEAFLRRSGAEFYRRVRDVFHWLECARGLVEDKFASFLDSYPLWGMEARTRELARLQVAVRKVILDEWNSQAGEFVAAELRFGEPVGVRLQVSQREFYVRGSIDWLIRLPEGLAVRELKTVGQALGEAQGLDLRQGLQLGLYVVAAEAGALVEKGSVHEATILTVNPDRVQRTLIATTALQSLRETTERALGVMFSLVRTGFFPRTPAAGDCVRCPFFAHCGEEASGGVRQASKEAHLPPAVAEYVNWRATISESGLLGGGCLEGAL
ncbi:MAG: PD-(D/E)XK nuclease family protein [Candidatus Binatia bacterium]|nr:PD-(D/E)XK nuclease family protein [Candidatus Binatia bacterium]